MERKDSNREVSFDSTWALIRGFSSVACALEKSESVKLSKSQNDIVGAIILDLPRKMFLLPHGSRVAIILPS